MSKRGRKCTGDDDLFEAMFTTTYAGADAGPASTEQKRLLYDTLWLNGKPGTIASYKSVLRQWAAWCQAGGMGYEAHPDMKVWLYMKHLVESRASDATTNLVSTLENTLKGLNLLRKCQPGIPEPLSLTGNELISALLKQARGDMRAAYESNTEIQCIHGTDRLTVDEQRRVADACDERGDMLGVQVRAILNIGIATGMRGDDLARRRYHQVWIDPEPLPWSPSPARVMSMSGRVSKANVALRTQYMSLLRHSDLNLCAMNALAELVVYDLNQPHALAPSFLDLLARGDSGFRAQRLFYKEPATKMQEQTTDHLRSMFDRVLDVLPDIQSQKTKSISILRTTGTSRLVREGCDRASLLNWGRWSDHTTADASYVCKEPLSALGANSILAGWGKLEAAQASHDIGRDRYEPAAAWVDAVTTAANGQTARQLLADLQQRNQQLFAEGHAGERNLDGASCLEALLHLARVFWQDLPVRLAARPAVALAVARLPRVRAIVDTVDFQRWSIPVLQAHAASSNLPRLTQPNSSTPAQPAQSAPSAPSAQHVQQVAESPVDVVKRWLRQQPALPPSEAEQHDGVQGLLKALAAAGYSHKTVRTIGCAAAHDQEQAQAPLLQQGFFSDRVKTVQGAYDEYYKGSGGRAAAVVAYAEARHTAGAVISDKDVQKRYMRRWLPEAMRRAIDSGLTEALVVRALDDVRERFGWSLAQLRDAFRLLAKGVPDEQELGQPRQAKTMGEFKAALQNWGLGFMLRSMD